MKARVAVLICVAVILAGAEVYFNLNQKVEIPPISGSLVHDGCDASLWDNVYKPGRLKVVEKCVAVKGVIEKIRVEKDGDYHILLKLDPAYSHLTNKKNAKRQKGNLVLEPICQKRVRQEDAKEACAGFNKFMNIPPVGTHVAVVGSYVLDTPHGWMEIHPVTSITEIE